MEKTTTLYRFLTGPDDASFCHRVSEALSRGWQLHGSPSLTYDAGRKQVIAGQAIIRAKAGGYAPDLDLKSE